MKIRKGFVSNSSSTSFIVIGEKPKSLSSVQLTEAQIKKVFEFLAAGGDWSEEPIHVEREKNEPVWLTSHFSDCCESEVVSNWVELKTYPYIDGGHGGPYAVIYGDEDVNEHYVCLDEGPFKFAGVWIKKEHA